MEGTSSKLTTAKPLDADTLPSKRSICDALEKIEVQGLAEAAKEILERIQDGDVVTHALNSTTKKYVGQFQVSGIHINKEEFILLPTIPVGKNQARTCRTSSTWVSYPGCCIRTVPRWCL